MKIGLEDILPYYLAGAAVKVIVAHDLNGMTLEEIAEFAKQGAEFVVDDATNEPPEEVAQPVPDREKIIDIEVDSISKSDVLIKNMYTKGVKPAVIASTIGKTVPFIYNRLGKMGLA